jgi:hypothetical protein
MCKWLIALGPTGVSSLLCSGAVPSYPEKPSYMAEPVTLVCRLWGQILNTPLAARGRKLSNKHSKLSRLGRHASYLPHGPRTTRCAATPMQRLDDGTLGCIILSKAERVSPPQDERVSLSQAKSARRSLLSIRETRLVLCRGGRCHETHEARVLMCIPLFCS